MDADDDYQTDFLRQKNLEFTSTMAPTLIYMALISVAGLVGNCLIMLVYKRHFKPSSTRVYVLAMSVCDLLSSIVGLPSEVLEIRLHATYYSGTACSFFRTFKGVLIYFSICVLVAVALDRQRIVKPLSARPLSRQLNTAYVALCVCLVVAAIFAVPYGVLSGNQTLTFTDSNVTGVKCSIKDEYLWSLFYSVYVLICFVGFVVLVVVMCASYVRIARHLWLHSKKGCLSVSVSGQRNTQESSLSTRSPETERGDSIEAHVDVDQEFSTDHPHISSITSDMEEQEPKPTQVPSSVGEATQMKAAETHSQDSQQHQQSTSPPLKSAEQKVAQHSNNPTASPQCKRAWKKIPISTTVMMFVLTAVFILSFLPHLVLLILWVLDSGALQHIGVHVYNILLRSYYINSMVNPWVYWTCSAQFRHKCRLLFPCKRAV